ncbi:MAG: MscL family protein [Patescibacteria group bacterium]|jgi:large conductance mechanosensitive channel
MTGFFKFIKEQGIVGLAMGFILGGSINKMITSLVNDIIQPAIGLLIGNKQGELAAAHYKTLAYGSFAANAIDFLIIAVLVYVVFKTMKLDKIDLPGMPKK